MRWLIGAKEEQMPLVDRNQDPIRVFLDRTNKRALLSRREQKRANSVLTQDGAPAIFGFGKFEIRIPNRLGNHLHALVDKSDLARNRRAQFIGQVPADALAMKDATGVPVLQQALHDLSGRILVEQSLAGPGAASRSAQDFHAHPMPPQPRLAEYQTSHQQQRRAQVQHALGAGGGRLPPRTEVQRLAKRSEERRVGKECRSGWAT